MASRSPSPPSGLAAVASAKARRLRLLARSAWASLAVPVALAFAAISNGAPDGSIDAAGMALWGAVFVLVIVLPLVGGVSMFHARVHERLARGDGVVARWTVDESTWRVRTQRRRAFELEPGVLPTFPALPEVAPAGGVEVVFLKDGLHIGASTWIALAVENGTPSRMRDGWLEFEPWIEGPTTTVIRVPVGGDEASLQAARRILGFAHPS